MDDFDENLKESVIRRDEQFDCSRIRYERTNFMVKNHMNLRVGSKKANEKILRRKTESRKLENLKKPVLAKHMQRRSSIMKKLTKCL